MPRQSATSIQNNFTQGLITESTPLGFPEQACTETYDCIFHRTGKVIRRPGIDFETGYTSTATTYISGQATSEYQWTAAGGSGHKNFAVVQQANTIYFYDCDDLSSLSPAKRTETITLTTYLPSGSSKVPGTYPCSYAQGNGDLFITNAAASPIYVKYDSASDTLTATAITVQFRDFIGLTSEVSGITTRPTASVATLKSGSPKHYYNLLNQGWFASSADALTQWDAAFTTMPSMADVPSLYRASNTDTFDPTMVPAKDPGSVPAPKGHFILTAWDHDRQTAMTNEGFTGATIGTISSAISYSTGTTISDGGWTNVSNAFNSTTSATYNGGGVAYCATGATHYLGKNYSSSPKKISSVTVYGSNNQGFLSGVFAFTTNLTLTLYGKQGSAPTTATDGTSLGSSTFLCVADESGGRTINSSDTSTAWDYVWVSYSCGLANPQYYTAEITFYATVPGDSETITTYERPSSTAFFAGRVWYAGIEAQSLSNNIYFSQIIQRREQYGRCYQANDPAGEYYNDLLSDDGGVIKILEMGTVTRLFPTRSALFVFATNGVWVISGASGAGFKATDYVVRRLSNIGTVARNSFIDFKGTPMWWAEDGIYVTKFDPQFESYTVENITLKTIKSFILDIPMANRAYVKGAYDPINDYAYWLYNDEANPSQNYDYTNVLVMNGVTNAFFPWTISTSATNAIRGLLYVKDPDLSTEGRIKFHAVSAYSGSSESTTFAEFSATSYRDWPNQENSDYTSYFITGYAMHGATQRFTQSNYVFVFMEILANSSAFVQGIYDFGNNRNSGRWSSSQQAYDSTTSYKDYSVRRLKVRGKGRSYQLRFASEDGKPFSIVGWSVFETSNQGI